MDTLIQYALDYRVSLVYWRNVISFLDEFLVCNPEPEYWQNQLGWARFFYRNSKSSCL